MVIPSVLFPVKTNLSQSHSWAVIPGPSVLTNECSGVGPSPLRPAAPPLLGPQQLEGLALPLLPLVDPPQTQDVQQDGQHHHQHTQGEQVVVRGRRSAASWGGSDGGSPAGEWLPESLHLLIINQLSRPQTPVVGGNLKPEIKFRSPKTILKLTSKADIKDETIKALKFIEYGCHRGFTLEELLQHEITNSAFFLVDKDGYLRKSAKSQLGAELLKLCPLIDKKGPQTSPKTHAAIIDFMALVRKVPLKKLHPPVKTFHDFAIALTSMVTKAGNNCDEIHIVFDTYREDSIKNGERERRGKSKDMVVLDVILPNQNVPVVLENFWSSSISKTAFQAFYVQWLTTNYQGTKPLYLGVKRSILPLHDICISLGDELTKCLPALHALTGCDTTSKISTKLAALNAVREPENSCLILNFDCPQLTESAIQMAETFLVKCLKPSTDLETFDDLRIAAFDSNALNMDFERTTCTSTNARKHILRGYYQQQLWVQAPFRDATLIMNAESYGFVRRGSLLVPEIVISKPEGLPDPCSCGKCARKNGCPCRVAGIRCCKYCKCKGALEYFLLSYCPPSRRTSSVQLPPGTWCRCGSQEGSDGLLAPGPVPLPSEAQGPILSHHAVLQTERETRVQVRLVLAQTQLRALSGHVSSEAQEGGDVDSVDVLRVFHVTAQVKLRQHTLPRLLLNHKTLDDLSMRAGEQEVEIQRNQPHAGGAQDVERRLFVFVPRDVSSSEAQQRVEVITGPSGRGGQGGDP
ncbi:hypothetical protein F7725_006127 [Dissostichus mawsoni]|uniref:Tesmin/TSO1-like CXC domain-containing protein n=1 Tax=Dissostichus mawsoni TaxID=36200 RepID=A0A7J5YT65_DISMA|nr:hypothetical protein F7725_006127 [Dissostichus mawsoni]